MATSADPSCGRPRVAIVGGGLAGLAAAAMLAEGGLRVVLLEARPRLGGRAGSFADRATGEQIDACQHVSMGCCTNLADFCRRVGIADLFRRDRVLHFVAPRGTDSGFRGRGSASSRLTSLGPRCWRLAPLNLPAPLHLVAALLRCPFLTVRDKLGIARGLLVLARSASWRQAACRSPEGASRSGGVEPRRSGAASAAASRSCEPIGSFADWLVESRQSRRSIERFWAVVLTSALSEVPERIDVRHARKVFVDGFLANRRGSDVLVPVAPHDELYGAGMLEWLARRGVEVRLNCAVRAVRESRESRDESREERAGGTRGARLSTVVSCIESLELRDGGRVEAEHYVLAVPFDRALALLPASLVESEPFFANLRRFESAPITSVHLWFDRAITELPHAVILGRTSQWLFARGSLVTRLSGSRGRRPEGGHYERRQPSTYYYQVVVSASRAIADLGKERIAEIVIAELRELLPAARDAAVRHARVVTERSAVLSVEPGIEELRPTQATPVPNLFLAGDWTRTGWPPTMESAVRSGYLAAEAILARCGRPARLVRADLPRGLLARWVLGRGAKHD